MDLEGWVVLVVGTGLSGVAAAELLVRVGACPVLFDGNGELVREEVLGRLRGGVEVPLVLGVVPKELEDRVALVVLSPGVPVDCDLVEGFRRRGVPVWGEVELAFRFCKGRVLAVTGTNGKTTTTSLLGAIMEAFFESVFVVGNIGKAFTGVALETAEDSVVVAEISSFQLETIHKFRPCVSAVLNVTPDHLNRHHSMENYAAVKMSIARNQSAGDICVLNYEDGYTRDFGKSVGADVFYFSSKRRLEQGIYLEGDVIYYAAGEGAPVALMDVHDMYLLGVHNVENVMAAIAMAYGFGVPMENILATVKAFRAVEHRIEFVASKGGVDYYNDSKGTNPDAAIKGIRAMRKPTLLIGGGYDKLSEFDDWIEAFEGGVKWLVLIGQTKEKIAECAKSHGFDRILFGESLEEAMEICIRLAEPGDAVLLSPACASWGMFPNYEVRGQVFKELVNKIEE